MNRPVMIAVLIFLAAIAWLASGFILPHQENTEEVVAEKAAAEENRIQQVRVRDLTAEMFTTTVSVTGKTLASRTVELKAEVDGQITELLSEKGVEVKEGQVIARVDKRDRAARVTEAKQLVNQRNIEYNAAQKLEQEGYFSRTRLAQAEADLESAKANLKQAELNLAKTEIRAPFDGVIGDRMVEVGDYATIGNPLFTILDLNPMKLAGFLSERIVLDVTPGAKAMATLLNGTRVEGTVTFIAPAADPATRTFPIEISLPNEDRSVIEGLTAEINIATTERPAMRVSPAVLTLNDAGQVGVKLVNDQNIVEFMPVIILSDKPDNMWIGGLPDKVRLITVGQEFVVPGQKVEPVPAMDKEGLL